MRIAIFTETYLPQINGVVTHIKILKEGLEALGHTVLIVTADAKAHRHYIEDGVLHCPAHTLKRIYNMCLASPVSSARLHYLREFNPDIIHLHTEFSVGLSGLAIAKILKVPVVYTLHTMYDDYIYYIAPKPLVPLTRKLSHHYFRIFPQHTNVVTGPSKKCQEYTTEIGSDKKVEVIPNPVELDAFHPSTSTQEQRNEIRNKLGIPLDATVACFVGRLGREKSVDVLLRFWAQEMKPEDNMRLMIVGDGPEKEPLEQLAKELKITDTVVFTGKVVRIIPIGAFIELLPGKDGMLHISKLSNERVEKVEDVLNIGDEVKVRVSGIDSQGRVNLVRADMVIEEKPRAPRHDRGERRDRGDRGEGPKPNYPFRSNGNRRREHSEE